MQLASVQQTGAQHEDTHRWSIIAKTEQEILSLEAKWMKLGNVILIGIMQMQRDKQNVLLYNIKLKSMYGEVCWYRDRVYEDPAQQSLACTAV